ncbi:MAG: hypothetical protein ACP5NC_08275, partial [Nitrososphaeria archaeon]
MHAQWNKGFIILLIFILLAISILPQLSAADNVNNSLDVHFKFLNVGLKVSGAKFIKPFNGNVTAMITFKLKNENEI